tara:strand:+ start:53 stop:451 length:399 start_codon:yes stop_codon:yes gene_type:complete
MANKNVRGESLKYSKEKKKKENEAKKLKNTQSRSLTKKEQKTYEASLKKGKTYTAAQLRFKQREAKGLSGLTGGKKGETVAEYRARQKKSVQDSATERNKKFQKAKKEKLKVKTDKPLSYWEKRRKSRSGGR